MVDKAETKDTSVDKTAACVTPAVMRDGHGENETHKQNEWKEESVLPADNGVLAEVANIRNTWLATGPDQHPPDVGVEKSTVGVVGVEVGVGVAVVGSVTARPPFD